VLAQDPQVAALRDRHRWRLGHLVWVRVAGLRFGDRLSCLFGLQQLVQLQFVEAGFVLQRADLFDGLSAAIMRIDDRAMRTLLQGFAATSAVRRQLGLDVRRDRARE
jgi:hypothetical protein